MEVFPATNILTAILEVWTQVLTWLSGAFEHLTPIFYTAESGLTFVGYLAIAGTALAAGLLFLNFIKSWMRFGN